MRKLNAMLTPLIHFNSFNSPFNSRGMQHENTPRND
jgi:hypothetical protein